VNLSLGLALIWVGSAAIWLATRATQATKPWEAFQEIIGAVRGAEE
jgi:hypothetical protein